MTSPDQNGPDGSSLAPVSSLRAKFENLHVSKPTETGTGPSPPRSVSPKPKPDHLRDVKSTRDGVVSLPPPPPKPRVERPNLSATHLPLPQTNQPPRSPARVLAPPPPLSPKPIKPTPSVLVEPPQSPPKSAGLKLAHSDSLNLLNPDPASSPATPAVPSRPFKIPSRSTTPVLDPGRSPRLNATKAPSPPPPRRSGELRREKEARQAPPPPVSRKDRPLIPAQSQVFVDTDRGRLHEPPRRAIQDEVSPFNSPPSSPGSPDEMVPPLPSRPKQPTAATEIPRNATLDVGFEPPPVHHSVATKRLREHEPTSLAPKAQLTPQLTGESRPSLPARPQSSLDPAPRPVNHPSSMQPPPRPPRQTPVAASESPLPPKRIASSPSTHILPPPTRVPGRSNTVADRTSERATSSDTRPSPPKQSPAPSNQPTSSSNAPPARTDSFGSSSTYPDSTNTNRRPPFIKQGVHEVSTKYDARIFDVCGDVVCTTGILTRVWSLRDGEMMMSVSHGEGIKATAISFKPGANVDEEGQRLWIGTSMGELMEIDIATQSIVAKKANAHARHEVTKIFRHYNELWTLDESGTFNVWGPDEDHTPNLARSPQQTYRVPRNMTFAMVVGDELWHATGKEIRVFSPTVDGATQFQILVRPLMQENAGDVTSGCLMRSQRDKVYFGHSDGKVSVYNSKDYSCVGAFSVSGFKFNAMTSVGGLMWAGFNNGKICVYDTEQIPWVMKKEWQAHEEKSPVVRLISDPSSCYRLERQQVISLGADNMLRAWDGLLQDDWQEEHMKAQENDYCEFEDLKVMVMTWNAGASTPHSLRYADQDSVFIRDLLQSSSSPDILVFGFQELVDLEDKTATAKRFLKVKKKEGSDQERMSHQYRDWRDFLLKSLDDFMPQSDLYHLLHTATLVGLFTCIFVKSSVRDRIRNLGASDVKRGMGGLHGNKGAIIVRFMVDDTSMCFINCHLAAGQSQANSRHNDVAAILEASVLPRERDPNIRIDSYTGGGDGTMILDHELCLLNGDLNYRIDTMSRDTVVMAVKQNNIAKLLERDQLLVARRRNPGFRLRAFEEMPITFAPTYKYDVGTDNYDTSEKRRSPAWCDRLLYRGRGRIKQLDYIRHEVRVSDHRPVTGRFKFTVKRIDPKARAMAWMDCQVKFEDIRAYQGTEEKMAYLTNVIGYDATTARGLIRSRKERSPSRTRA